ncbi:hypothetical protein TBLA_0E04620 [Henningerozyma blattae CBS 6284]|uniref:Lysophospholipase NTE1 n=1 Tax=Henningerozyma blattae (strain ATCC 34711 / CBS 6284 / DSM 70876 / NBRC 10599 / NRRL Y-10934 / UCD 77-7) TaxID=1071380 RepID=I2H562_HENB6|nr:hypothetical protein TBLA_0E04620 [Tetrapisispora blattae CBS 6284]CCH61514.1 hypothetical protein TBLA_0E04620 [Tetrapisispora blattae CBS 6284]
MTIRTVVKYSVYLANIIIRFLLNKIFFHSKKTFIFSILFIGYLTYYLFRDRALSPYKKLTPDIIPLQSSTTNQHPISGRKKKSHIAKENDTKDTESHPQINSISSYLEKFLRGIKIFGYLEKPVFNSLIKNIKTQKLSDGELLIIDDSSGFIILIEGTLQLYHRAMTTTATTTPTTRSPSSSAISLNSSQSDVESSVLNSSHSDRPFDSDSDWDSDVDIHSDSMEDEEVDSTFENEDFIYLKNNLGKYQLLNIVKNGSPVSSLVNILNLFTDSSSSTTATTANSSPSVSPTTSNINIESERMNLNDKNITSNVSTNNRKSSTPLSNVYSFDHKNSDDFQFLYPQPSNVIARAATDCTIAIIPSQAFKNLTSNYPKSSSHIIQMILTKLFKVTFQISNYYLGLTDEIIKMESLLNNNCKYLLPNEIKKNILEKNHSKNQFNKKNYSRLPSNISVDDSNLNLRPKMQTDLFNGEINESDLFINGNQDEDLFNSNQTVEDNFFNDKLQNSNLSVDAIQDLTNYNDDAEDENTNLSLASAILSFLGVNEHNFKPKQHKYNNNINNNNSSSIETFSNTNLLLNHIRSRKLSQSSSRSNSFSINNSNTNHNYHHNSTSNTNLKILPSDFAIKKSKKKSDKKFSNSTTNSTSNSNSTHYNINKKKKKIYKEIIPEHLTFESAKIELAKNIEVTFFKKGTTIVEQDTNGKGLFYIIDGKIDVTVIKNRNDHSQFGTDDNYTHVLKKNSKSSRSNQKKSRDSILFTVETGGIAGFLSSLIGYKSFVNLKAKTDVYVAFLSNKSLETICDKYVSIYLRIANTLTGLLSPRLLRIDHALEWVHLSPNEVLFEQNDPSKGIYVLLNGRLREFRQQNNKNIQSIKNKPTDDQKVTLVQELSQGESFGEVEVLTSIKRISSIVAIRESELARIPKSLFEFLAVEQPSVMFRITRTVAKKIMTSFNINTNNTYFNTMNGAGTINDNLTKFINGNGFKYDYNLMIPPTKFSSPLHSHGHILSSSSNNFKTITILPITNGIPIDLFAMNLVNAFKQVGRSTIALNQRSALTNLGKHAFDGLGKLKQSGFFTELEENYEIVVYIADAPPSSSWTTTCITQGDCVLLVADADQDTEIGETERLFLKYKNTSRTELILLHSERSVEPGSTIKWLKYRNWVHSHHHIQLEKWNWKNQHQDINSNGNFALTIMDRLIQTEFSKKTQENISKLVPDSFKNKVENFSSKFIKRKQRYYTSVNPNKNDFLRLARILSGQAIGLVLGGGGARGFSHLGIIQALEEKGIPIDLVGGTSMGSFVGGLYARDYDIVPIYGRMKKFAGRLSSIWRTLSDLTLPLTSYTTGHEFNRGIWKAFGDTRIEDFWLQYYCNSTNITESVQEIHSMGYAWRYIRASMTIAGLLPPLEENGLMLLDGGYVDNLPVDEMKARGCTKIFAVDVGSVDERLPVKYGDSLNGFWVLWNRWNPFSKGVTIPTLAEIQVRLAYVASVNALEKSKNTDGVVYVRPPIENYATLEFGKFDEIYKVGVEYGRNFLKELEENGEMPYVAGTMAVNSEFNEPQFKLHRRNSI